MTKGVEGTAAVHGGASASGISVEWRKIEPARRFLFVLLSVVTASALPIVLFFYPVSRLRFGTTATLPELAEYAIATVGDLKYVVSVEHHYSSDSKEHIVVIEVNSQRFSASSIDNFALSRVAVVPPNFIRFLLLSSTKGDSERKKGKKKKFEEQEQSDRRSRERDILLALYGSNTMKIPDVSILEIFAYNALSPFFLFQYFAVGLWFYEDYILYSVLILVITMFAIYSNASEQVYNLERLKTLAGAGGTVPLLRPRSYNGESDVYTTPDAVLVPGDRILVSEGMVFPCDCVLIRGRVVVDESMLTGESIPVTKVPIELGGIGGDTTAALTSGSKSSGNRFTIGGGDEEIDLATRRAGSVLFSGTAVKASQGQDAIAVVYRTGFRSAKGQLVASLLTPRDGFLVFFRDAFYIILFMIALTVTMYLYVAFILKSIGATDAVIAIKFFDAITIAVPPGLSACLTVATAVCIARLKALDIYVSDTSRVNWAGTVTATSFDKTGTLTQDNFDFQGAEVATTALKGRSAGDKQVKMLNFPAENTISLPARCLEVMATCHSLSLLPGARSPTGDFLEVELFRASGWALESDAERGIIARPPIGGGAHVVMRHFEFNADRLRSATLLRRPDGSVAYLLKGSPETIARISDRESIPVDLQLRLKELTKRGFRVIAMAHKVFPEGSINLETSTQDEIESGEGIEFLGLLYLSSKLKVDALTTIRTLRAADIHTNMITGDHIQTAISVAVACGILKAPGSSIDTLYVIDEGAHGEVVIVDFFMDSPVAMKLEYLLNLAAASTLRESSTKKRMLQRLPTAVDGPQGHEGRVQIAVTGGALLALRRTHSEETVREVVRYTSVFARTKPVDKKNIVEAIMKSKELDERLICLLGQAAGERATSDEPLIAPRQLSTQDPRCCCSPGSALHGRHGGEEDRGEYHVVFCGDGANDISALRAATVGVSLCDAATSVAAPVTSRTQDPGSVVALLKEGRCSLVTAYVLVLYNIMYGVIQLFMCLELYRYGLVAGSYMYLIQDLFFVLVLSLAISYSPPSDRLSASVPPKTFFTKHLVLKLFSQLVCFCLFQGVSLNVLSVQDWYSRFQTDDPLTETFSYEATTVDSMALAQLMIASVVSTIGEPFRKSWNTNKMQVTALALQFAWLLYQLFGSDKVFYQDIMQLKPLPVSFGFTLLALMFLNLLVSVVLNEIADGFRPRPRAARYDKLMPPGEGSEVNFGGEKRLSKEEERPLIV